MWVLHLAGQFPAGISESERNAAEEMIVDYARKVVAGFGNLSNHNLFRCEFINEAGTLDQRPRTLLSREHPAQGTIL